MSTSKMTPTVTTAIRIGEELVKTKPLKYNALVREIARVVSCGQSTAKIAVMQLRTAGHLVNVNGTYTWTDAPVPIKKAPFTEMKIFQQRRNAAECAPIKPNPEMWTSLQRIAS